jgi:hypothetical protein
MCLCILQLAGSFTNIYIPLIDRYITIHYELERVKLPPPPSRKPVRQSKLGPICTKIYVAAIGLPILRRAQQVLPVLYSYA